MLIPSVLAEMRKIAKYFQTVAGFMSLTNAEKMVMVGCFVILKLKIMGLKYMKICYFSMGTNRNTRVLGGKDERIIFNLPGDPMRFFPV